MKHLQKILTTNAGTTLLILGIFSLCFGQVYMRIETTLIGYELGKLKKDELSLLEERSRLQMTLSKMNSRQHLQFISSIKNGPSKVTKALAMKDKG